MTFHPADVAHRPARLRTRHHPPAWKAIGQAVLLAILCLLLPHAHSQAPTTPVAKLVIGVDEDSTSVGGILARLLFAEIARRMAVPMDVTGFPQQRRSAMADEGLIDGETARVHAYGAAHPNLVRVEEPLLDLSFALYTTHPALKIQRLEDLSAGKLLGEYRRGVLFCEKAMKSVLPAERLSDVTDTTQGTKKLIAGRTDVFCDLDIAVLNAQHDPDIKGVAAVRRLLDLGTLPTYPYLHKKHAALAPRMAAVIKAMKTEGLIDAYSLQARREMGWIR